jgi:integrase
MTELHDAVEEYIAVRRALGTKLRLPAAALRRFADFAAHEGAPFVTTDLALRWAREPAGVQSVTWASRLGVVRRFAAWRSATDPRTEVPPRGLLPQVGHRSPPYVYSDEEIERLLAAAACLPSPTGLRAATFATLFGLLAATGLRVGEALTLDDSDVDLADGVLVVRKAKFGKSRFVPVHESTRRELARYALLRDRVLVRRCEPAFLVTERGLRVKYDSAAWTFATVSREIGLRAPGPPRRKGCGPRMHDLRHRFATRRLVEWYRAGLDVQRELPKLATYLGHVHMRHTFWYVEAVPELLALATERLVTRSPEVRS